MGTLRGTPINTRGYNFGHARDYRSGGSRSVTVAIIILAVIALWLAASTPSYAQENGQDCYPIPVGGCEPVDEPEEPTEEPEEPTETTEEPTEVVEEEPEADNDTSSTAIEVSSTAPPTASLARTGGAVGIWALLGSLAVIAGLVSIAFGGRRRRTSP